MTETLYACDYNPDGTLAPVHERPIRRRAAAKAAAWLRANGKGLTRQEAKDQCCKFVLETVVLGALITAVVEFIVETVLNEIWHEINP